MGYVARACGDDSFLFISENLSIVIGMGSILLGLFIPLATPVIFQKNKRLQTLAWNANNSSFESFGMFWGVSTTLFFSAILVIYSDLRYLIQVFHHLPASMQTIWLVCIIFLVLITSFVAFLVASIDRSTFAVPYLYLLLAKLCCCCKEVPARMLVTFLALWFDLLALEFLTHHCVVAFLAIPAAPLTIVTNVLSLVLVGTCVVYSIALMFTICAKLTASCSTHNIEDPSRQGIPLPFPDKNEGRHWSYYIRAAIPIPFLIAIALFSVLLASSGKYVNSATEQGNFLSFLLSLFIPFLFAMLSLGIQWFISKWLK